ncbi:MAG TPA: SdpI family protein [Allosphingosinicella sp.]|jgi:uncharacterized membrane protein
MNRTNMGIASLALVLLMAVAAAAVAASIPGDVRLPIHWNIAGEPDNYAGKWVALLIPAAIAAGLSGFFYLLPRLEPRAKNFARSQGLYMWAWASILLLLVAVEAVTISVAFGWHWRVFHVLSAAIGAMFAMMGNQLGKSRSMYLVGIRTPWTLASEEVWIRTHRLGGKLMVAGGLLLIVLALLPVPSGPFSAAFAAIIGLMVAVPVAYSYLLWRRERKDQVSRDAT